MAKGDGAKAGRAGAAGTANESSGTGAANGTGAASEQAEALSYEQARDELASVVKRLEAGGLTLEQSLELWERGERLAAVCGGLLDGARARLTAVMAERSGDAGDGRDPGDPETPF